MVERVKVWVSYFCSLNEKSKSSIFSMWKIVSGLNIDKRLGYQICLSKVFFFLLLAPCNSWHQGVTRIEVGDVLTS